MTLTPREQFIVQFSYELSLTGIGAVALKLYETTMETWGDTPRWKWRRRRNLLTLADQWVDLYRTATAYEQEQAAAAKETR